MIGSGPIDTRREPEMLSALAATLVAVAVCLALILLWARLPDGRLSRTVEGEITVAAMFVSGLVTWFLIRRAQIRKLAREFEERRAADEAERERQLDAFRRAQAARAANPAPAASGGSGGDTETREAR